MRESIGGAWLLGLVMVFMMVFIAFVSISLNYSKVYILKTNMITVLEEYQGLNTLSVEKLDNLINSSGYMGRLTCSSKDYDKVLGVTNKIVSVNPTNKQSYCVTREVRDAQDGTENKYYYNVIVTFAFSLPVLGDIFDFKVSGETNAIIYPTDNYF